MNVQPVSRAMIIKLPKGLHARPAEMFARLALQFDSQIELIHEEMRVDAKSILEILTLGAAQGTELVLEAQGADAQQAVDSLYRLVDSQFDNDAAS